jgi:hypothetical protein
MIKIPDNSKKFTITNTSDLRGNIWYTKNINFDEEGYMKLSSRVVSLQSEQDDSDFDIPISYGRTASGSFLSVTADAPWVMNADQSTGLTVQQDADTGVPTGGTLATFDVWGCWWQNRWYMSTATGLYYKSGGVWTNASITATTTGKVHPIAVFSNKQTLCIGNGNAVVQINTSHAVSTFAQLTIPADYEVAGLSYVTNRMGVATKLSDSATEQNQEAMFFVWDGVTSSANGGYPVGSDQILGVVAYKSSWAVLTRNGRLLYFNGGGFDELASFPFYSLGLSLGESQNRTAHGDIMAVEGDVIYINISNDFNKFNTREEIYIENNPAGIWCYEPKVGLYHRYAPSISSLKTTLVSNSNVDTTTNILTATSSIVPETGNPCVQLYNSSDKIGGIIPGTIYYVIKVTSTQFKLATTRQNAIDNQPIDITAQAAGSSYFAFMNLVDFGLTLAPNRVGGIGIVSKATNLYDHLMFGGEYEDYNSSGIYAHGLMTVPQFENRGYFLTVRMNSQNVEDIATKLFIKYKPLGTGDSIILKYKNIDKLGIPVTTPQINQNPQCTWTSTTVFTTTNDLSDALTQFDAGIELECEVINGAGAGCMEKITGLTEAGGTYTVTVENEIIGVTAGYVSNVIINNYKYIGTVTSDKGWEEFPINGTSKYIMIKCELRGVNTTVEEIQLINDTFKSSK